MHIGKSVFLSDLAQVSCNYGGTFLFRTRNTVVLITFWVSEQTKEKNWFSYQCSSMLVPYRVEYFLCCCCFHRNKSQPMNCVQRCNCCAINIGHICTIFIRLTRYPTVFWSIEIISSGKPALPAPLLPALTSQHLLFHPGHCLKRWPHIVAFGLYPRKLVL